VVRVALAALAGRMMCAAVAEPRVMSPCTCAWKATLSELSTKVAATAVSE
jgi:hypothetical protein